MKNLMKVLTALMITASNAGMVTMIRGGFGVGARKPKILTANIFNTQANGGIVNEAQSEGVLVITGETAELKDQKMEILGEVFVGVGLLTDFAGSAARFGVGVKGGWRHTLKPWTDNLYGNHKTVITSTNAAIQPVSIERPKGVFFVNPELLFGFDISQVSILASIGVDCSLNTYKFHIADAVNTSVSNWLFGIRAGIEMVYPVGPCFGVGVGVIGTYWPKAINRLNQKGKFAEFVTGIADTEKKEIANMGKTWSVMGQITANFIVN